MKKACRYLGKHPAIIFLFVLFAALAYLLYERTRVLGLDETLGLWIDYASGVAIPVAIFSINFQDKNIDDK